MIPRVKLTEKAAEVVRELKKEHGDLLFFQSGGCCEGSQPLLYPIDDFRPGSRDVLLGTVEETPYYMSEIEFKYWKYTQLLIDVVAGVGVGGFSLESTVGYTFVTKSHLFTEDELAEVEPVAEEA